MYRDTESTVVSSLRVVGLTPYPPSPKKHIHKQHPHKKKDRKKTPPQKNTQKKQQQQNK